MGDRFADFHQPLRAAVIGASGGIGNALVTLLEEDPRVGSVHAFARRPERVQAERAVVEPIEITDENSIARAARHAAGVEPLDLVLVATGLLHRGDRLRPEKSMRDFDPAHMTEMFAVNAIAPAIVGRHFLPTLRRGSKTVFAALSARVGSIADNRLGGWASYRASKAALNMLLKTMAIEHARRNRESVVVALHPGTVDTPLSAPFQGNVPGEQLFSPERAARQLLDVIDGLVPGDSGDFFAWDGERVPF